MGDKGYLYGCAAQIHGPIEMLDLIGLEIKGRTFTRNDNPAKCTLLEFNVLSIQIINLPICIVRFRESVNHCASKTQVYKSITLSAIASMNIGLMIIALLIAWMSHAYFQSQQTRNIVMSTPQIGDIYFADLYQLDRQNDSIFRYALLYLSEVSNSELTFNQSRVTHKTPVTPFVHLTKGAYSGESLISNRRVTIPRGAVPTLVETKVIYDIKRPRNGLIDGWIPTRFIEEHDWRVRQRLAGSR